MHHLLGRIMIDFIDPLIVAERIATTENTKYLSIRDIKDELRDGEEGISGIVIGNVGYLPLAIELKEKYSIELIGEYTLNVFNSLLKSIFRNGLSFNTLSISAFRSLFSISHRVLPCFIILSICEISI